MCTAVTYQTKDFYFGRTLDYEFSYGEEITLMPRCYPLPFRHTDCLTRHYALLGMAHVADGYPLYYDAVNEHGLAMAGLNFVGNAEYRDCIAGRDNIAQFELIPWLLSQCRTVAEARVLLGRINITNTPFSSSLPPAQLHWLLADRTDAITIESVSESIHIYDNPVGVLTNNPPFAMQMQNLRNYMHLSSKDPVNSFSSRLDLKPYSRGMGGLGLPGDLSSQSRFVRAAFTKLNSLSEPEELPSVSQFFHILSAVSQTRGCCQLPREKYEITIYSSCCNTSKGIYYYTTYDNHRISAVDMHREDLDDTCLRSYPLTCGEQILWQN